MYIELIIKAAPHINPAKSEPYTKQSKVGMRAAAEVELSRQPLLHFSK